MEEENKIPKALNKNEGNGVKTEKMYRKKDLIITAIIAFLIGAIITAGGFAINKSVSRNNMKNFRPEGIQREFSPEDFDGSQRKDFDVNGQNGERPSRSRRNDNNAQNSDQNNNQNSNNQNAPNVPATPSNPNNAQQPNA